MASRKELLELIKGDAELVERLVRIARGPQTGQIIRSTRDASEAFGPVLAGQRVEHLAALFLDRRNRVIALEVLTVGSDSYTVVDPRQVFQAAMKHGAHAVILGHNHPSGDPTPSMQDVDVTRRRPRGAHRGGARH